MERANAAKVPSATERSFSEGDAAAPATATMRARVAAWSPIAAILIAGGLLIPLVVSVAGEDPFRFPKDLALRAEVIVPPAVVNAAVYVLQELDLWTPFDTSGVPDKHLTRTALMGNPNYVGSYLVAPAVVALALALTQRRGRLGWAAAAAFLVVATFMTYTVGAIVALVAALPVMIAIRLRSPRPITAGVLAALLAAGVAFVAYRPLHERVNVMRDALKRGDLQTLSAMRAMPFLAAAEMARDHPLTGVGPGGLAYNYFDYKLRIQERYRSMFGPGGAAPENFGEVHNDHLQVASETGLPGYALFAAALLLLASATWQSARTPSPRVSLTRVLALPLVVSFAVLALSQFPLELVAATHAYLWAAAAIVAWRPS